MTAEFVLSELQSVGSPEKAAHLSRFFKTGPGQYGEGDRFLGVVVPQTRSIAKANKAMPLDELQRLLDSPWHEARLCALLVLVNVNLPSKSVIPPLVVPFSTTLAPIIGSPAASTTKPLMVIACNCSVTPSDLSGLACAAITLPLLNNSELIATAVRSLLCVSPRFL
jgi:hypothetical protein